MELNKNQKTRDFPIEEDLHSPHNDLPDMSIIQNCFHQKKVCLLPEQQLLTDNSFYISFTVELIPNHKVYVMYITSYRIYMICTVESDIVTIPHAYIKDFIRFDNQIRFTLKTGLRYFLTPEQATDTQMIFDNLKYAQKLIPFCLNVKFKQQQPLVYDCLAQLQRMLINWKKVVAINNQNGQQIPSYPKIFFAPAKIDKQVVKQCQLSRVHMRIPALSYYSNQYNVSLWRCGHTIKQQNSKYDYAYLQAISQNLLIIQLQESQSRKQSIYGGFNHFNNQIKYSVYKFESLSQVRINYQKVVMSYLRGDNTLWKSLSKWYEEVDVIIRCAFKCCEQLKSKRNVLIQENDFSKNDINLANFPKGGVDRASQLCSLIQIVLDPFYRSIKGFTVLIEKQFTSFGYPFHSRCGFQQDIQQKNDLTNSRRNHESINLMSSKYREVNSRNNNNVKINGISPTFIQFLECLSQLINCYPEYFEYSGQFLAHIGYQLYTGKYNTFLFSTIHQKTSYPSIKYTQSIYRYLTLKKKYYNIQFNKQKNNKSLLSLRPIPNIKQFLIWKEYWDIVTKMNCLENQREDLMEIREFKELVKIKKVSK